MLEYRIDHIPISTPHRRRQGVRAEKATITIHNTGNEDSSAENERAWLTNPSNDREASWNIVVDEYRAIEAISPDEKALHAGDNTGNVTSIGVEICESGDYEKTLENAVQLVAKMLKERKWGVDRLRRHWDWSGKICPRLMYDGGTWAGWIAFKNRVAAQLVAPEEEPMTGSERNEFEKLQRKVEEQSSAIGTLVMRIMAIEENVPAPKWFVTEFGVKVIGVIKEPTGTVDFWRSLAVSLRVHGFKK
ncbi:peptidoglycan recognition protein family protein [Cohnella lupini]|uniref:N-acetylmuramoyl-L-alanine amidase n=1 Tax=Cohnella lupini TaxID=1294267 RepID=A0A3D9HZJ6_9BACL|nr:N-acetylmuramoyl-L-alanine amidase [Cohnella lupini]RED54809.1 N-acetylmuramoyl-L-alanine amidase [Cohnella lupini]